MLFSTVSQFHIAYFSQAENTSSLTIKEIMQGEACVGYLPENHRWSADGKSILFSWNPEMDSLRSTYKADVVSGDLEVIELFECLLF